MNKERTFEFIAKRISEVKMKCDPIIVKATYEEVVVLACKGYIIPYYLLKAIHDIAEEFIVKYYVSADAKGNIYVKFYL